MKIFFTIGIILLSLVGCLPIKKTEYVQNKHEVRVDTLSLFDQSRNRRVPVAFYNVTKSGKLSNQKVVIFNHGYGENRKDSYLVYSYLTEYLASIGYFVVSIQHELPTDSLIPSSGIPQVVRRPFWDRGADNIMFLINELKQIRPELNFKQITLIGHSNGADMVALFPQKYANIVEKIITLDNRRMALPRTKRNPEVYSLRSSDQPADEGVLPTRDEQKSLGITIIQLPNTIHNDMDDHANPEQRKEINNHILSFLN